MRPLTPIFGIARWPADIKGFNRMLVKQMFPRVRPEQTASPSGRAKSLEWNMEETVERQLAKARQAWRRYQSSRRRDAVYGYLSAIFDIVRRWKMLGQTRMCSVHAFTAIKKSNAIRTREPFSIIILRSSDAGIVDAKTRSKWSRCLRYADRFKPNGRTLTYYIKSQGGINHCAHRWDSR